MSFTLHMMEERKVQLEVGDERDIIDIVRIQGVIILQRPGIVP